MSSYFDRLSRDVITADEDTDTDKSFLRSVKRIEEQLFNDVTAVIRDREFPDDLREKMLNCLAVHSAWQPGNIQVTNEHAEQNIQMCRRSEVVDQMHGHWHELARRRVETRFGVLSDSPTLTKLLRDEYDEEFYGKDD